MLSEIFRIEKIIGVCEKICYFFVINFLFLMSVIPVLLFFMFLGISQVGVYLPLFMLTMLSVPPALCAVFYGMKRLVDGREREPWRDYWKGYGTDFFQKFRLGFGHILVLFILWTNVKFFAEQIVLPPMAVFFTLLFAFAVLVTPNLYLLASRYEMKNMDIVKTACVLTITKPACTLGSTATLGVVLAAFELVAGTAVLFMVSIYGFFVVYISGGMLHALEDTSKEESA